MEETMPQKMTSKDAIPRKLPTNKQGKGNRKVYKKDIKSPPKAVARKRNMSRDSSSNAESVGDTARDKDLEQAQHSTFGRKRPDFKNLKSSEKEKEDGEIQPAHDKAAGLSPPEEYKA